ncbi:ABC transporter permease [Candidatus Methylocalor cossyra]|uniref:Transport permease protein n=1 Tax=Candidatus Methylocalor cossyra TaxID=3108543 RepID=A0ABP1C4Q7_9GAMM
MLEALGRWQAVWRRNALAWRKSARTALLGGFAEPLFYLFALGYGLGGFIREVEGLSYLGFLMAGILSTSAMNAATFEGLYLAYTRMEVLRTWDSMLAAPLGIDDVVMGEVLWMGTKSLISAGLILIVTALLGMVTHWTAVAVLPVAFLAGICFGGMALVVTSFARSYDFFVYYITLLVTPMVLLSGVFFPLDAVPSPLRIGVGCLPLLHVVETIRPLVVGRWSADLLWHLAVMGVYAILAVTIAIWRLRRRLLR